MSNSPVFVYDIVLKAETNDKDLVKTVFKDYAKKWVFQLERGDSGYEHYQGQLSLIKKRREAEIAKMLRQSGLEDFRVKPKCTKNMDDWSYVSKKDTRVEGPWGSEFKEVYIPKQIREIPSLYPWQQTIVDDANKWDTRSINVVYCPKGNNGKTTLIGYIRAHKVGRVLPLVKCYKDILRMVENLPTSKMYLIDMPRAIKKENLSEFWAGVETIKDGYAYDDRYQFKEKVFDCPNIWVFTNEFPDMESLSNDRWIIWTISEERELIKYMERPRIKRRKLNE